MSRRHLPNRRRAEAFDFDHAGVRYRAVAGRFEDGTLAELFLTAGKPGSPADTLAHDAAVILSIALQHGVPIGTLYDALVKLGNNAPAGPVGVALKRAAPGELP